MLGAILQEVGVFVCMNELAYALAMAATPIAILLDSDMKVRREVKRHSVKLLKSAGSFTVLNYEEGLREVFKQHAQETN